MEPTKTPNYMNKLLKAAAPLKPGEVSFVNIAHDDWCGFFSGSACNCNPDVTLSDTEKTPRPAPFGYNHARFDQLRAEFRTRLLSDDFWIIVFDDDGRSVIGEIANRHYVDAKHRDEWIAGYVECDDGEMNIVALIKRRMSAIEFAKILTESGIEASESDVLPMKYMFIADKDNHELAEDFAAQVLGDDV